MIIDNSQIVIEIYFNMINHFLFRKIAHLMCGWIISFYCKIL